MTLPNKTTTVGIAVLSSLLMLLGSCDSDRRANTPPSQIVSNRPDAEVLNATIYLYEDSRKTSQIQAARILKWEDRDSTVAYEVDIDFFDSLGAVQSNLVGDSALIREMSNEFTIFGNVVANVGDTTELVTEMLTWEPETGKIVTPAYVKITRQNDVITGIGLEAERDLSRVKILKSVSGTIEDIEAAGEE